MKILFLCRFMPYPTIRDSGGQDLFHYIEGLADEHEISLIGFVRPTDLDKVEAMHAYCQTVSPVLFREKNIFARLWRLFWRLAMAQVYGRNISLQFARQLKQLLKQQSFDLVIIDGMMGIYGRYFENIPVVLDEIDIYTAVAQTDYQNQISRPKRLLSWLDWQQTHRQESRFIKEATAVFVRSPKDKQWIERRHPQKAVHVLPPWFEGLAELSKLKPKRPLGNKLLFVGAMNHAKNVTAVTYFAQQIFPLIQLHVPNVEFYIVGSSPAPQLNDLTKIIGVHLVGEVENLTPYYQQSAINVVPLLTGGGIIVKTLNGMAAGVPTVATQMGYEGIQAIPNQDLIVVPTEATEFAKHVIQLLTNHTRWQEIAENGQQYVAQNYAWPEIMDQLQKFLKNLCT